MVITPDSIITLYENVDIDFDEQLLFSSYDERDAYFNARVVRRFTECTIVKNQTSVIQLEVDGATASRCNYMSFRNPSFEGKTIYCRIAVLPEYVNNETTRFTYSIDYWLSYFRDVSFDDMYIEREHLSSAKKTIANNNPFHESLWEFRTAEPLPISKDTEQLYLDYNTDFYELFRKSAEDVLDATMSNAPWNRYYTLIYMSSIDFAALDANVTNGQLPSTYYGKFASGTLDFRLDNTDDAENGNSWRFGAYFSNVVGAYNTLDLTNRINPGYVLIGMCDYDYNPNTGYYTVNAAGKLTEFLDKLTQWGVLSSVINIYRMPVYMTRAMFYTNASSTLLPDYDPTTVDIPVTGSNVTNKKLLHYPFSYMRVMSPMGDEVKEYHYEKFYTLAGRKYFTDGRTIKFNLLCDTTERPTLIVAPAGYNFKYNLEDDDVGSRFDEAMFYNKFPTMPYTIDSWLAQMAANAQGIIQTNTTEYLYQMGQESLGITSRNIQNQYGTYNALAGTVSAAGQMLTGNISGGLNTMMNTSMNADLLNVNVASTNLANQSLQNRANMSDQAYNALAGAQRGNAVYDNFAETRPAYAANKYVPMTGDGVLNYSYLTTLDMQLIKVHLNEYVEAKYDKWFSNYGYASGRCGIPYSIQYAQGATDSASIPSYSQLDDGRYITYVKTNDCRVIHAQAIVAENIRALFNNGVRFVKAGGL